MFQDALDHHDCHFAIVGNLSCKANISELTPISLIPSGKDWRTVFFTLELCLCTQASPPIKLPSRDPNARSYRVVTALLLTLIVPHEEVKRCRELSLIAFVFMLCMLRNLAVFRQIEHIIVYLHVT